MIRAMSVLGTLALLGASYLLFPGCGNDCAGVHCDTTRVELYITDADGEASGASRVTYTLHPYDDEGELMDETELDDADIDITEARKPLCGHEDEDGNCAVWVAEAGFGLYSFDADLVEDGLTVATNSVVVDLPPPAKGKNCCGKVDSAEAELVLDPDAAGDTGGDDTGDSGDSGA